MFQSFKNIQIEALSSCVPENKVLNEDFSYIMEPKELRKFGRTTGIKERRYSKQEITASDLAYVSTKKIIEYNGGVEDIDVLIFLSQTPDYKIPFTSNILQNKLGLKKDMLCLDINAGCAGFIQGLSTAFSYATTVEGKVLFVVAETLSKILSKHDKSTTMLFGDGASSLLISKDDSSLSRADFNFFTDGENADAIIIPEGGCRIPFNDSSLMLKEDNLGSKNNGVSLHMDGPRVFDFTLREVPKSIEELVSKKEINIEEIESFLFHQSNKFIINQISSKLKISKDKVPLNIDRFGNTSNVSIPLLMTTEFFNSKLPNQILLSGYGAGLNWGNCVLKTSKEPKIFELIEI